MVAGLPLGIVAFVVAVGGLVAGLGTLVVWIGLPILVGTLRASNGLAALERRALRWATGRELPPSRLGDIALGTAIGLFLLVAVPWVLRGLVAVQAGLARGLLTNQTAALRARAEQLAAGRRAAVQAEAQTLRRLERDIHDGPQQRLVRLNMDLESAARRIDDDPDRVRPLLVGALEQTREALSELRTLSAASPRRCSTTVASAQRWRRRPPRCPVQVSLDVALPGDGRLSSAVENAAYFVVTEALTNVAKHSGAADCVVTVGTDGAPLLVQVRDDGRGGAHVGKGHGLAGGLCWPRTPCSCARG